MKTIKAHIKSGQFVQCYLLCGSEEYLKRLYLNKLIQALIAEDDSMNLSVYEGERLDYEDALSMANTLPFFAERRVLVFKNTGCFKGTNLLGEHSANIPDTTVLLFLEKDVDKKSSLYRYVSEHGYVCEIKGMDETDLKLFVASGMKSRGLSISTNAAESFLDRCGTDMTLLTQEMDKLAAYCMEKGTVETKDVRAVTTVQTEGRIFSMIDALSAKNKKRAIALYGELLLAQEKPLRILYMLTKNYFQLSMVLTMARRGVSSGDIASRLSLKPFVVTKYLKNSRNVDSSAITDAVAYGNDLEYRVKIGDLDEHMAVEMFIMKMCDE